MTSTPPPAAPLPPCRLCQSPAFIYQGDTGLVRCSNLRECGLAQPWTIAEWLKLHAPLAAADAVAAEREACAKVCDDALRANWQTLVSGGQIKSVADCAAAIRARATTETNTSAKEAHNA